MDLKVLLVETQEILSKDFYCFLFTNQNSEKSSNKVYFLE